MYSDTVGNGPVVALLPPSADARRANRLALDRVEGLPVFRYIFLA